MPKVDLRKLSIPILLGKAEEAFNKYIRQRDDLGGFFICISCGRRFDTEDMDAGHYFPVRYSAVRFDEDNVHGESIYANRFDPNHLTGYKERLIEKIGIKRFEALEQKARKPKKWDRDELITIIETYKNGNKTECKAAISQQSVDGQAV